MKPQASGSNMRGHPGEEGTNGLRKFSGMERKGLIASHHSSHAEGWIHLISNVPCCPFPIQTSGSFGPSSLQGLFFISVVFGDVKSWMSPQVLYCKCFSLVLHLLVNVAASGPDLLLGWHSVPDEH